MELLKKLDEIQKDYLHSLWHVESVDIARLIKKKQLALDFKVEHHELEALDYRAQLQNLEQKREVLQLLRQSDCEPKILEYYEGIVAQKEKDCAGSLAVYSRFTIAEGCKLQLEIDVLEFQKRRREELVGEIDKYGE